MSQRASLRSSPAAPSAAAVAGSVASRPAARSARPAARPARASAERSGEYRLDLASRPRRNRRSPTIRGAIRETFVTPSNLILPIFIHASPEDVPVSAMPGVTRRGPAGVIKEVGEAIREGVNQFVFFPAEDESLKTRDGKEASNPDGLVQRTLRALREKYPDVELYTDVALDPYNSDGHDGIVRDDGVIDNDATVACLVEQALSHARAGANVISPSDMMDGRVGAIREALDSEGFTEVSIMSYAAKYASCFYGPFREALGSAPKTAASSGGPEGRRVPAHKRTYQQDPANVREAIREAMLDEAEGADALLIKPGLPYLDVIRAIRERTELPLACYQVSGEYAMLAAAIERGMLDERAAILETITCLRRAGCDYIMTYFATRAARMLQEQGVIGDHW